MPQPPAGVLVLGNRIRPAVVATVGSRHLYIFGRKRGVELDTMSVFFARLHLETQAGCAPSA
jgi:hypothetical protein